MIADDLVLHGPTEKSSSSVSLGEYYIDGCQNRGGNVALVQQVDGVEVSVTYSELLRRGKVVAGLLREHGLGSGDTVMLCCGNTLEFAPILLGTLFVGGALAPINPGLVARDMLHLINTIKPQIVISNTQAESSVQEALAQYSTPVVFIAMETVNKRVKENPDVEDFYLGQVDDPDTHVAFVMCSSGTSGRPKGVEYTHRRYLNLLQINLFPSLDETKTEQGVAVNLSGPFWMTCHLMTLISFHLGYKLVILDSFHVDMFFSLIQHYKVNIGLLGPSHLVAISRCTSTETYDLSSLQGMICSGASAPSTVVQAAQQKLHRHVTQVYGMTEGLAVSPDFAAVHKPRSCGRLGTNASAKVVHIKTGQPLGPNCEGELCFKSQATFLRYRDNPRATEEVFDEDGFLHTGDIATYDEDGYFYVVGRIKELVKYKGHHVPVMDIEEVLLRHPKVLEAAVIGVYHEVDWEHATAIVAVQPAETVTEEELVKLVEGTLPSYKWLHGGVRFVTSLPKTVVGKIQKYMLRQQYSCIQQCNSSDMTQKCTLGDI